jgi:hypothetical protein
MPAVAVESARRSPGLTSSLILLNPGQKKPEFALQINDSANLSVTDIVRPFLKSVKEGVEDQVNLSDIKEIRIPDRISGQARAN